MARSRPITGASTAVDVAASAVNIWIASVIASAIAAVRARGAPGPMQPAALIAASANCGTR